MKTVWSGNRKYGIAALTLAVFFCAATGLLVHFQKEYVPDDPVRGLEARRSQVYLSGRGYTPDRGQLRERSRIEKKRGVLLEQDAAKKPQKQDQNTGSRQTRKSRNAVSGNGTRRGRNGSGRKAADAKKPSARKDPGGNALKPPDAADPDDISDRERDPASDGELSAEERAKLPVIKTSLVSGDEVTGAKRRFWVAASDCQGRSIPVYSADDGSFSVICNGEKLTSTGASGGKTYFIASLKDGRNTFRITAEDREGRHRTITRWIKADTGADEQETGSVTVTVSASIIGKGTLCRKTVKFHESEPVSELVTKALSAGGFRVVMSGGYLYAVGRAGIVDGYHISEETKKKLEEERATEKDPSTLNRNLLREKDFYSTSGWLYSVNGNMPDVGMGSYVPADGDEIRVFFALSQDVY